MKQWKRKSWAFVIAMLVIIMAVSAGSLKAEAKKKSKNQISLNHKQVTAYLGMKSIKLKVKNLKTGKKVKWSSKNPKVATVEQNGTVTFVSKGNTIIRAKVGKKTLKCVVSICSKKAYKAVEKAEKFYKARNMSYSQSNRMGRRSADCSSFCGRCYLAQGLTLGGSKSWCNTAAGMAAWATKNHKVVANGAVSASSLRMLPGDLIFYRKGYNGRYKNIYHVEIFIGYGWDGDKLVGYTMSSITGNYPSILKRDYASRQRRVVEIARPAK